MTTSPGCVEMRIRTLDTPAHLEDRNVAVVRNVVDVVGQILSGRAAHIFDAFSRQDRKVVSTQSAAVVEPYRARPRCTGSIAHGARRPCVVMTSLQPI